MSTLADFDWQRLRETWDAWWCGERKAPMFNFRLSPPPGTPQAEPPRRFWASYDFQTPPETVLDCAANAMEKVRMIDGGHPSCWLNFGPGALAAMVGGEGHATPETVWFTPGRWAGVPIREIHPRLDRSSAWFRRLEEFCRAAETHWKGRIQFGCTDLGGTLDVVSSLLPGEQLLYALYDEPDEIKRLTAEVHEAWFEAFDYFHSLMPSNPGYTAWDGIFSSRPYYMLQCDFCYMISPEMFGEFVLPELAQSCRRIEHSFYHLDGKGELPHLDQLLSIPELAGIQWVPGDGAPPFHEWTDVYCRIAAAGKKIWLAPQRDLEGAARVIDATGRPELFVINDWFPAEREEEMRTFMERYS